MRCVMEGGDFADLYLEMLIKVGLRNVLNKTTALLSNPETSLPVKDLVRTSQLATRRELVHRASVCDTLIIL